MEGSLTIFSFITSIGLFLGLTLSIFLLFKKSAKNKANLYLAILVFLISLQILRPFLYFAGWIEYFPHLLKIDNLFILPMGPVTYFYVSACTQKNFRFKNWMWIHFLPVLVELIYYIPIITLSGSEKLELIRENMETGILINPFIIPILKFGITGIYFIACIQLIVRYRKYLGNTASFIDESFQWWLLIYCSFMIYPFLGIWFFLLQGSPLFLHISWIIFICAIYASALLQPELFHSFSHQMPIQNSKEEKKQRYENSTLQESQKENFKKKLNVFMQNEKPFLAAELTINQLAQQINIPAHHLSQVINEKMGCNFLDFINSNRIQNAKAKLSNPKFSHYTILSIAFESGFNSKSAFYAAFKKHTGTTPSNYRKSIMN